MRILGLSIVKDVSIIIMTIVEVIAYYQSLMENIQRSAQCMKKIFREVVIDWDSGITLEEAIFRMSIHDGECYVDGDRKVVVFIE